MFLAVADSVKLRFILLRPGELVPRFVETKALHLRLVAQHLDLSLQAFELSDRFHESLIPAGPFCFMLSIELVLHRREARLFARTLRLGLSARQGDFALEGALLIPKAPDLCVDVDEGRRVPRLEGCKIPSLTRQRALRLEQHEGENDSRCGSRDREREFSFGRRHVLLPWLRSPYRLH